MSQDHTACKIDLITELEFYNEDIVRFEYLMYFHLLDVAVLDSVQLINWLRNYT